jgi:hypothetical protein
MPLAGSIALARDRELVTMALAAPCQQELTGVLHGTEDAHRREEVGLRRCSTATVPRPLSWRCECVSELRTHDLCNPASNLSAGTPCSASLPAAPCGQRG